MRRDGASVSRLAASPLPARRTGRADLPHPALIRDHALRPRKAPRSPSRRVRSGRPRSSEERSSPRPLPGGRDEATGRAARTFPTPRLHSVPSLPHAAPSGVPEHETEVLGDRHSPRPFLPSCALPEPRPLRSAGVTRPLRYFGPIRHPAGSSWPSRVRGWRVRATDRASRVAASFLFPTCQRHYPGGNGSVPMSLTSRPAVGLPRRSGGSASALRVSRPAQRSLAFWPAGSLSRPRRPFVARVLQPMSIPP